MGCLKLTYYQTPELRIISNRKELTFNKSVLKERRAYLYGFNGMEKDDEMKNSTGNSYTTMFRQYDPRLGRFMSMDPVVYPWQSDYAAFNNNPIYFADPSGAEGKGGGKAKRKTKRADRKANRAAKKDAKNGGGDKKDVKPCEGCGDHTYTPETPPVHKEVPDFRQTPKEAKFKVKAISFSLGDKPSIKNPNGGTRNIPAIFGNNQFYNTTIKYPYWDQLTEPDLFINIQVEFENKITLGAHFNKEKFYENNEGFGTRGPTNVGPSFGINYEFGENSRFSGNTSFSFGFIVGEPGFGKDSPIKVIGYDGFQNVGGFVTLLTKVNYRVLKNWYIFLAGTVSYRSFKEFKTTISPQLTPDINSIGLNLGIGLDLPTKK